MATVLFINRTDLVRNSILDGNVDTDKFIFFIKTAQEIHIQNYLSTDMYNGLTAALVAGIDLPANARWKTLLDDYVVPMLIWFTQVDYIPFASYQIRNGGMFKEGLSILCLLTKQHTQNTPVTQMTTFIRLMMRPLTVGFYEV